MEFGKEFDKLRYPLYVCSSDWRIVYKNKMCRRKFPVPRKGVVLNKFFVDGDRVKFPSGEDGVSLVVLKINSSYVASICFEYRGCAVLAMPTALEFDQFVVAFSEAMNDGAVDAIRGAFDVMIEKSGELENQEDRYGRLEAARKYIYNLIGDLYVMNLFGSDRNIVCSLTYLYRFIKERVAAYFPKIGRRLIMDYSELEEAGKDVYINITEFMLIFANAALFALSVAKNGALYMTASASETGIVNRFEFSVDDPSVYGEGGDDLSAFMKTRPIEYLNIAPFEAMCKELGWKLSYSVDEGAVYNMRIDFETTVSEENIFRSREGEEPKTAADYISEVLANAFGLL